MIEEIKMLAKQLMVIEEVLHQNQGQEFAGRSQLPNPGSITACLACRRLERRPTTGPRNKSLQVKGGTHGGRRRCRTVQVVHPDGLRHGPIQLPARATESGPGSLHRTGGRQEEDRWPVIPSDRPPQRTRGIRRRLSAHLDILARKGRAFCVVARAARLSGACPEFAPSSSKHETGKWLILSRPRAVRPPRAAVRPPRG